MARVEYNGFIESYEVDHNKMLIGIASKNGWKYGSVVTPLIL